ncbi:MAG: hypothetical protein Q9160_002999 [Pyrenula sp. 1 TL-2023]
MASPPAVSKAPFPAPPPFWREFTAENITRLESIKKESKGTSSLSQPSWKPSDLRALDLPTELRHLVPPHPPTEATYRIFGQPQSVTTSLPSLSSQGVTQLFPDTPPSSPSKSPVAYLLLLAKSLLLNFNEFTSILSSNPVEAADKLDDIKTLFVNAHYLINMYRPHQARETLILMMEEQIRGAEKEIEECDRVSKTIKDLLEELENEGNRNGAREPNLGIEGASPSVKKENEDRALWAAIHALG